MNFEELFSSVNWMVALGLTILLTLILNIAGNVLTPPLNALIEILSTRVRVRRKRQEERLTYQTRMLSEFPEMFASLKAEAMVATARGYGLLFLAAFVVASMFHFDLHSNAPVSWTAYLVAGFLIGGASRSFEHSRRKLQVALRSEDLWFRRELGDSKDNVFKFRRGRTKESDQSESTS